MTMLGGVAEAVRQAAVKSAPVEAEKASGHEGAVEPARMEAETSLANTVLEPDTLIQDSLPAVERHSKEKVDAMLNALDVQIEAAEGAAHQARVMGLMNELVVSMSDQALNLKEARRSLEVEFQQFQEWSTCSQPTQPGSPLDIFSEAGCKPFEGDLGVAGTQQVQKAGHEKADEGAAAVAGAAGESAGPENADKRDAVSASAAAASAGAETATEGDADAKVASAGAKTATEEDASAPVGSTAEEQQCEGEDKSSGLRVKKTAKLTEALHEERVIAAAAKKAAAEEEKVKKAAEAEARKAAAEEQKVKKAAEAEAKKAEAEAKKAARLAEQVEKQKEKLLKLQGTLQLTLACSVGAEARPGKQSDAIARYIVQGPDPEPNYTCELWNATCTNSSDLVPAPSPRRTRTTFKHTPTEHASCHGRWWGKAQSRR